MKELQNIPVISVIVPVYNVQSFLQDCIDSLMNQSFSNYEVIFVNDASTDDSLKILRANETLYHNMKVIDSPVNMRQGGARNLGIKQALGQWIAFVDSDDMVSRDFLNNMYDAILDDTDVVFCQYSEIDEYFSYSDLLKQDSCRGGIPLIIWNDEVKRLNNINLQDSDREILMVYPIGGVYCGLWKKDLIVSNDVWFPEGMRYEDNYWGAMIKAYIKKALFIEKVGYYYRINSMSTVHKRNAEYQFDRIKIENKLLLDFKDKGFLDRFRNAEEYLYIKRYTINSFWLFLSTFDDVPKDKINYVITDLKRNFPKYRKNIYYKHLTSKKERIKNELILKSPSFVILYWKLKQIIKR